MFKKVQASVGGVTARITHDLGSISVFQKNSGVQTLDTTRFDAQCKRTEEWQESEARVKKRREEALQAVTRSNSAANEWFAHFEHKMQLIEFDSELERLHQEHLLRVESEFLGALRQVQALEAELRNFIKNEVRAQETREQQARDKLAKGRRAAESAKAKGDQEIIATTTRAAAVMETEVDQAQEATYRVQLVFDEKFAEHQASVTSIMKAAHTKINEEHANMLAAAAEVVRRRAEASELPLELPALVERPAPLPIMRVSSSEDMNSRSAPPASRAAPPAAAAAAAPAAAATRPRPPPPAKAAVPLKQAKGVFQFVAADPQELSFNEGDILQLHKTEGEWWTAEKDSKIGLIPSNYVQLL